MKSAFYTLFHTMLAEKGAEATARFARECGFDSVEFYCDMLENVSAIKDRAEAEEVKRVLDAEDLPVVCCSVAYDAIALPDAEKTMRPCTEVAHALGSPFLHHTLLIQPDPADSEDDIKRKLSIAADAAVAIAKMADAYGLICIYEDQGKYVNGIQNFSFFFENVKSRVQNVGVCADLGNILYVDEAPEPFLRHFAPEVKHLHVRDRIYCKEEIVGAAHVTRSTHGAYLIDTPLGEGSINIPECVSILKAAGYRGACALELPFHLSDEEGLKKAVSYLANIPF